MAVPLHFITAPLFHYGAAQKLELFDRLLDVEPCVVLSVFRFVVCLAVPPLAELLECLESRSQTADETSPRGPMSANLREQENTLIAADSCETAAPPAGELSSAQYFRELRQQRAAQDRVSRALQEAPEDSGPLNPQKLVIRSMLAMRDLSPGYLARFVSYVDTLFWLENTGTHKK